MAKLTANPEKCKLGHQFIKYLGASDFPDPDVVLSGSHQRQHPGAEGVGKNLPAVAEVSPGETRTPSEKGMRGNAEGTTAAQEIVAAPVAAVSARETWQHLKPNQWKSQGKRKAEKRTEKLVTPSRFNPA
ncbi:hypothetical protein NDU88_004975 [Pleurodeles waltl]|uniref:Uncharacterized protein n=1 Tax=Pleurodeles waltl TaxID=8319 RepID=A0AAV7RJN2_PLEWA|nr:hypothetical protein NDU88_004975 [Pleurodeles waltl]